MQIAAKWIQYYQCYSYTFVTESAKIGLICIKYTYSFCHIYLFFCVGYTISVSCIEFLRKLDEFFDIVLF